MKPRAAWGPLEYAQATGRDRETIEILKGKVAQGMLTLTAARKAAEDQGFDPDKIGKAAK